MADLENQTPEPEVADTPAPEVKEASPHEQRAMEQGWVPKDQWEGNPDDWRPAKEFLDRGDLFKKIDDQKRELKQMKAALEDFGKHHARVRELEYKRALEDLKAQKKVALEEADHDAVVEIDERIAEVKEASRAQPAPQVVDTQPDPMFTRWAARNPWYETDRHMKAVADEVARELVSGGVVDKAEILAGIDKSIRQTFPHKFNNPNREKAGAVEGTVNKSNTRERMPDMTDAEKRIMNGVLATGVITKEQYLEEFKAIKGRGAN